MRKRFIFIYFPLSRCTWDEIFPFLFPLVEKYSTIPLPYQTADVFP